MRAELGRTVPLAQKTLNSLNFERHTKIWMNERFWKNVFRNSTVKIAFRNVINLSAFEASNEPSQVSGWQKLFI